MVSAFLKVNEVEIELPKAVCEPLTVAVTKYEPWASVCRVLSTYDHGAESVRICVILDGCREPLHRCPARAFALCDVKSSMELCCRAMTLCQHRLSHQPYPTQSCGEVTIRGKPADNVSLSHQTGIKPVRT